MPTTRTDGTIQTVSAEDATREIAPVELEIVPRAAEAVGRRGRPPGSRGKQIERVKCRLAQLVVGGKRIVQIADTFDVSPKTVRNWLADPEVQREICAVEREFLRRTERRLMLLFGKSISTMARLLKGRGTRRQLHAVELVWIAVGRLPPMDMRTRRWRSYYSATRIPRGR